MQKVLHNDEIDQVKPFLEQDIMDYISENLTDTYEEFEDFILFSFDWFDVESNESFDTPQILIYLDRDDMFIFCEDERSYQKVLSLMPQGESNERVIWMLFRKLIKNDMTFMERLEDQITESEDEALSKRVNRQMIDVIVDYRNRLMELKHYYEQLADIFENVMDCDNGLISDNGMHHFDVLLSRTNKRLCYVQNMRDYVTQMREAYQAQIDIEQNDIMKVFTVITGVFFPLSILVGWYGMNFAGMPELTWRLGYPIFIVVSAVIVMAMIIYFRKKKWF